MRMNMAVNPPPDLAIEADVTSKTTFDARAVLQVPEVWIYDRGQLQIHLLAGNDYRESTTSLVFPDLPVSDCVPQLVAQALKTGTSKMLRTLRQRLQKGDFELNA